MGWNWHRVLLAGLLLFGTAIIIACEEDNPEDCYQDSDCPDGKRCITTKYLSGNPSGGYCVECISDADCTDPAFPTCNELYNTCECRSDSGICGPAEGGVEGGVPADDGAVPSDGATEVTDDAGQVHQPDDAGQ